MRRKPKRYESESLYRGNPIGYVNLKAQGKYFKAMREYHGISKWGIIADLLDNDRVSLAGRVAEDYSNF